MFRVEVLGFRTWGLGTSRPLATVQVVAKGEGPLAEAFPKAARHRGVQVLG